METNISPKTRFSNCSIKIHSLWLISKVSRTLLWDTTHLSLSSISSRMECLEISSWTSSQGR